MIDIAQFVRGRKHVIFDWNGTLLDDMQICVDTINDVLESYSLKKITVDFYRMKFQFPVKEYYKCLGFDFEQHHWPEVSNAFIRRFDKRVKDSKLFDGATQLLDQLKHAGVSCSILSAAHTSHLSDLTMKHGIASYFDFIVGANDTHAHGKLEYGVKLLKQLDFSADQVVLIGDTNHDHEVATAMGIDSVILGDGHQHRERLHGIRNLIPCRYQGPFC